MADPIKITGLAADANPTSDDLVLTVNDPGGSPANKKVTLGAIWAPASTADAKGESASTRASSAAVQAVAADTKAESASTRASSVQVNVANESSSRVAADNALDTKAESASTRGSSAAVQAETADSKAVSVELQFSYIATTTLASSSTLSTEQIQGNFIMVSDAITITLPAVVIGALVTIYSTGANAVVVDPNINDRIVLDGTALGDGVAITSASAAGDYVTLIGDSADGWTVIGRSGTWT